MTKEEKQNKRLKKLPAKVSSLEKRIKLVEEQRIALTMNANGERITHVVETIVRREVIRLFRGLK